MIRFGLVFLICMIIASAAGAAVVGGYVYTDAKISASDRLEVGYLGYQTATEWVQLSDSVSPGSNNLNGQSPEKLSGSPHVLMTWAKGKPGVYRCTGLKPGLYMFYAMLGKHIDWKTITVPPGNSSCEVNFSIKSSKQGKLALTFERTASRRVQVYPAWDNDQVDWKKRDGPRTTALEFLAHGSYKTITLDGLRAGKYLVEAYEEIGDKSIPSSEVSPEFNSVFLGQWVVEVKAGKTTAVTLVRNWGIHYEHGTAP